MIYGASGGGSKLIEHVFPFNLSVILIFNDRKGYLVRLVGFQVDVLGNL